MIRNALFWANYIRDAIVPFFDTFIDCIENRLLPVFANIEEEANKYEREEYENLGRWAGPDSDPALMAELAQDNALRHYQTMRDISQGVLNLYTAALYHQWEQQLLFLYRRELLPHGREHDRKLLSRDSALMEFAKRGVDIKGLPTWESIEELRLVANVIKHAEGGSAADLRQKRPDLFRRSDPIIGRILPWHVPIHLYQPLWGTISMSLLKSFGSMRSQSDVFGSN